MANAAIPTTRGNLPSEGQSGLFSFRGLQKQAGLEECRRMRRLLTFERAAAEQGFLRVAGVDEAGRGPLAGPIVAGAVLLARPVAGLNDSKMLTHEQREALFETLCAEDHVLGVGIVPPDEIDRIGIQQANFLAMAKAVSALTPAPDYLLVDGFQLPGMAQPVLKLIKGDQRSLSIAAASIVAKVTRDRLMQQFAETHPGYGFERHKGYFTPEHIAALERLGPCAIHRRSFAPIAQYPEQTLML